MSLDIDENPKGNGLLEILMKGELVISTVKEAKEQLLDIFNNNKSIEIDFKDITSIDTAGYQFILSLKLEEIFNAKRIKLKNFSKEIVKIFDLFGEPLNQENI